MERKSYSFFLIVPKEFNGQLVTELNEFTPHGITITQIEDDGGVLIEAPLQLGCTLNTILKTPSRILLRLEEFKARDFPRLFNKIKKMSWRDYLNGEMPVFTISSHRSRLINTTKIEKCLTDAISRYYVDFPPKKVDQTTIQKSNIYLRVVDDLCTISIDTTGEILYKRGDHKHIGIAPIRETIATSLLLILREHAKSDLLIDPMAGSGTFLLESINYGRIRPPSDFLFTQFPILKKSPPLALPVNRKRLFLKQIGIESDKKTFDALSNNLKDEKTQLIHLPFEEVKTLPKEGAIILNPPYNERIKIKGKSGIYYQELIKNLFKLFRPEVVGIIIPRDIDLRHLIKNEKLIPEETLPFSNGGIPVTFYIFKKG